MPTQPQTGSACKRISIVIPVYNERDTWRTLLAKVQSVDLPGLAREIVLVEDGSTDGTRDQLRQFAQELAGAAAAAPAPGIATDVAAGGPNAAYAGTSGQVDFKVIFHARNSGKGAALRTGFAAATGDIVIVQDADLEYDPRDYPNLIAPIVDGQADVVYGSRFLGGGGKIALKRSLLANKVLTWLSNRTTGLKITDMETCYKVVRRDVLGRVKIEQNRFGFEPEITAKLARLRVRIVERPIAYIGRTHDEGKKIGWKDGVKAVWCIIKYGLGG
jgi:glycosyltransferase involved in cell wall biosynthesis